MRFRILSQVSKIVKGFFAETVHKRKTDPFLGGLSCNIILIDAILNLFAVRPVPK